MQYLTWFLENWSLLLNAVIGILGSLIVLFLLIPGPHPEDWFEAAKKFLEKFSRK
jgi:hypothetical protein